MTYTLTFAIIVLLLYINSYYMPLTTSRPTSKFQITIPAWVRQKYKIDKNTDVVWMETGNGELTIVPKPAANDFETWLKNITGFLKDDSWDSVEEIRKYRQEELEIEKRKYS